MFKKFNSFFYVNVNTSLMTTAHKYIIIKKIVIFIDLLLLFLNPFMPNAFSHPDQFVESISNFRVVG